MTQMTHPLTLMVIFPSKVPKVAAIIAGILRTGDTNPVLDAAGNAGLPCVSSPGIPPHLAHHASNAIILIRRYISHLPSFIASNHYNYH